MKKDKIMLGVLLGLFVLLSAGLTYAYFTLSVSGNEQAKTITVQNTTLSLQYIDSLQITANNIEPGWSTTKTISVYNDGTSAVAYSIGYQNLINQFTNDELVVSATCSSNLTSSECDGLNGEAVYYSNTKVTATSGTIIHPFIDGTVILPGERHTYTLTYDFIETNSNQNYNQGKTFAATLGISESNVTRDLTLYMYNGSSPLVNTNVTLHSTPITQMTNSEGKVVFTNVPVGNHILSTTINNKEYSVNIILEGIATNNVSSISDDVYKVSSSVTNPISVNINIDFSSQEIIDVSEHGVKKGLYVHNTDTYQTIILSGNSVPATWSNLKRAYPNAFVGNTIVGNTSNQTSYLSSLSGDLYIDKSVNSITNYAFYGCNNLNSINYNGTIKEWLNIAKDATSFNKVTSIHPVGGDVGYFSGQTDAFFSTAEAAGGITEAYDSTITFGNGEFRGIYAYNSTIKCYSHRNTILYFDSKIDENSKIYDLILLNVAGVDGVSESHNVIDSGQYLDIELHNSIINDGYFDHTPIYDSIIYGGEFDGSVFYNCDLTEFNGTIDGISYHNGVPVS